ncbi:MAG: AraC family transcriptional regulator, partial [Treponema sp.]|nr:AraC family transcriptional regulator [Treponema sp.]
KEGYFYLSAPGIYHTQRPANTEEFIEYSLNCNLIEHPEYRKLSVGKEVEQIFGVFTDTPCFPVADHYGILTLYNEALEEAEQRRLGFEWTLYSLVPEILVAAARSIELEQKPESAKSLSEQDLRMTRIEEYVLTNIQNEISPKDLAEYMNLSEKQISRIVMSHKGFPTKKYITRTKLNRAKELLASGDMPIKEIAASLGFSSEYYFNSVFKLHVGCPPGVFRSSMVIHSESPDMNVQKS